MKTINYLICIILLSFCFTTSIKSQVLIDLESGFVFSGYNDVRIPGNQGTLISLKDDLTPETKFFYRVRLNYTIKSRHTLSLLYAPLEIQSEGIIKNEVFFEGKTFPANTQLNAIYKFNSYRLTYRYDFVQKPTFEFGLGLTAKIRDARIALSSPSLLSEKKNVGFVPIINFRLLWKIDDKLGLLFEGDALAAPQGRAADVLLATTYKFTDNLSIRAGYRILEGGSDSDKVYNFALINYATFGITYNFNN